MQTKNNSDRREAIGVAASMNSEIMALHAEASAQRELNERLLSIMASSGPSGERGGEILPFKS